MLNTEFLSVIVNGIIFGSFVFGIIYYFVFEEKLKAIIPITLMVIQYMLLFGPLLKNKELILEEKITGISKTVVLDSRSIEYKKYIYHIQTKDNGYKYYQDELKFVNSTENKIVSYRYSSKIPFLNHKIFTQIVTKVYMEEKNV